MDVKWTYGVLENSLQTPEAPIFVFNISDELLDIGRWMRDEGPSTDDALIAVENYASKVF